MEELHKLKVILSEFSLNINKKESLAVHRDNKFNKQIGSLLRDRNYIEIIVERIEATDAHHATQLGLDLRTLYVFGRVFAESALYLASLFINSSDKIRWNKIGEFIDSVEKNIESESSEMKDFWTTVGHSIKKLNQAYKYRNYVLHEKESTTEWIFSWPSRSNLDYVYIANVPWREDAERKEEKKSLNARILIQVLYDEIPKILNHLERAAV